MKNKYYRVEFVDLGEVVMIEALERSWAVIEAVKTLRDCKRIDSYPKTPEEWSRIGEINVKRAMKREPVG